VHGPPGTAISPSGKGKSRDTAGKSLLVIVTRPRVAYVSRKIERFGLDTFSRRATVNKAELIDTVAERLGGSKREANDVVEVVLDSITRAVAKGDRVALTGFGTFEKVDRPARYARNPRTGERVRVKKTSVPKFKAGADFKGVVSGAKKLPRLSTAKTAARSSAGSTTSRSAAAAKSAGTRKTTSRKTTATGSRSAAAKKGTARKTAARGAAAKKGTTARTASTARRGAAKKSTAKKGTARRTTKRS
jgi:DNA-binding protein HU-beta